MYRPKALIAAATYVATRKQFRKRSIAVIEAEEYAHEQCRKFGNYRVHEHIMILGEYLQARARLA